MRDGRKELFDPWQQPPTSYRKGRRNLTAFRCVYCNKPVPGEDLRMCLLCRLAWISSQGNRPKA